MISRRWSASSERSAEVALLAAAVAGEEDRPADRALRPGRLGAARGAQDVAGGHRDDVVKARLVADAARERLRERAVAAVRAGAVISDVGGIGGEDDLDAAALDGESAQPAERLGILGPQIVE